MNEHFKKALPALEDSTLNAPRLSRRGTRNNQVTIPTAYNNKQELKDTVFVLDRDKGLQCTFKVSFPMHLAIHCAKHIESNVCQKYGKQAAKHILPIARSFLIKQENYHLELLKNISTAAHSYIEQIPKSF